MSSPEQYASSDIQLAFGSMLIGGMSHRYGFLSTCSWIIWTGLVFVASFLQGTLTLQAWNYYEYFPHDFMALKALVSGYVLFI